MSKQRQYHPIFDECVNPGWKSYNLRAPWVCDGWRYASNGHITVRQRCNTKDTRQKKGDSPFPNGAKVFDGTFNVHPTKIPLLDDYADSDTVPLRPGYAICCERLRLLSRHKAKLYLPKKKLDLAKFTIAGGIEGRIVPTGIPNER